MLFFNGRQFSGLRKRSVQIEALSQLSTDLSSLLGYNHLVIVAYHSKANGLVERRKNEL